MSVKLYEVAAEDEASVTYQHNTLCGYWFYTALAMLLLGLFPGFQPASYLGAALSVAYFVLIYFPAAAVSREIRQAIRDQAAEVSGSRWSVGNPLTIKIPRQEG